MGYEKDGGVVGSADMAADEALSDVPVNESGHAQELDRNFGLWNICGLALTSGNTWVALGGSIAVAMYNGGAPGVIYEFIAASVFYWFIAASLAELSSAIPTSGGVYDWASITGGRYGRPCGFFAGWINYLAWIFGAASTAQVVAQQIISAYALMHPDFEPARWHVFVTYIVFTLAAVTLVAFGNRLLPTIELVTGIVVVSGFLVTIIVCAVMPHVNGQAYATDHFVWRDWQNSVGWSDGFTFCLGMLNGAFAVGTPDVITHIAEEVPHAQRNIPLAMAAQYAVGFVTGFCYLVALFYGIHDIDLVLNSPYASPLTEAYRQVTGTRGGSIGLTVITLIPLMGAVVGCYMTSSRLYFALARDNAVPFSPLFAHVSKTWRNPFYSVLMGGFLTTILGCIYMGSDTAFTAFVSAFVVMTTISYLIAILPNLLRGRKGIARGAFFMHGALGFVVNSVACAFIVVFVVIFCFPAALPVDAPSMNYTCLITGGLSLFVLAYWFVKRHAYRGPAILAQSYGSEKGRPRSPSETDGSV
ncbi:hypothetical protein KEM52_005580 [Ascosphaera acerosa]|nr:hypothetical protein KEM52_005580 [Ascosphaera acerosa]